MMYRFRLLYLAPVLILVLAFSNNSDHLLKDGLSAKISSEGAIPMAEKATVKSITFQEGCSFKGIELKGKVQVVNAFADIKVQFVDAFPDVKVKEVTAFPDDCGEWQYVDAFPDFTIEIVDAFPDVKVQRVDAFPGIE